MQTSCHAPGCSNCKGNSKKLSYICFPFDPIRCLQWTLSCRRQDFLFKTPNELAKNYTFCSEHFAFASYNGGNRTFAPDACPTIFNFTAVNDSSNLIPVDRLMQIKQVYEKATVPKLTDFGDKTLSALILHLQNNPDKTSTDCGKLPPLTISDPTIPVVSQEGRSQSPASKQTSCKDPSIVNTGCTFMLDLGKENNNDINRIKTEEPLNTNTPARTKADEPLNTNTPAVAKRAPREFIITTRTQKEQKELLTKIKPCKVIMEKLPPSIRPGAKVRILATTTNLKKTVNAGTPNAPVNAGTLKAPVNAPGNSKPTTQSVKTYSATPRPGPKGQTTPGNKSASTTPNVLQKVQTITGNTSTTTPSTVPRVQTAPSKTPASNVQPRTPASNCSAVTTPQTIPLKQGQQNTPSFVTIPQNLPSKVVNQLISLPSNTPLKIIQQKGYSYITLPQNIPILASQQNGQSLSILVDPSKPSSLVPVQQRLPVKRKRNVPMQSVGVQASFDDSFANLSEKIQKINALTKTYKRRLKTSATILVREKNKALKLQETLKSLAVAKPLSREDFSKSLDERFDEDVCKQLFSMLIRNGNKSEEEKEWTEEDMDTAANVYAENPDMYEFMRELFSMPAADDRVTIRPLLEDDTAEIRNSVSAANTLKLEPEVSAPSLLRKNRKENNKQVAEAVATISTPVSGPGLSMPNFADDTLEESGPVNPNEAVEQMETNENVIQLPISHLIQNAEGSDVILYDDSQVIDIEDPEVLQQILQQSGMTGNEGDNFVVYMTN